MSEQRVIELIRELYSIHSVGGPLHVAIDDGNLDGVITPSYEHYADAELDALWFEGWPIAELDPGAPAVVEGLGRSMRQICDELAAALNTMTVDEREAAIDRAHEARAA